MADKKKKGISAANKTADKPDIIEDSQINKESTDNIVNDTTGVTEEKSVTEVSFQDIEETPIEKGDTTIEEASLQEGDISVEEASLQEGDISIEEKEIEPIIADIPVEEISELITAEIVNIEDSQESKDLQEEELIEKSEEKIVAIKSENKPENKEPSKIKLLLTKYKLPLIIAAIVLIVALAVVITIVVVNKNYVMIYSDIDFVEKSTDGKTTYVIKKDVTVTGDLAIPHGMNIDLNKNNLTVTGIMSYAADAADKDIYIGDRKGPLILANGSLNAGSLNVNSPNASLTIYSPVKANGNFNLKKLKLESEFTSNAEGNLTINTSEYTTIIGNVIVTGENGVIQITSSNSTIIGNLSLNGANSTVSMESNNLTVDGDVIATIININDTGLTPNIATINSSIIGTFNVTNSSLILSKDSTFTIITADNLTTLDVNGTINISLDGGLLVIYRSGSSCPLTTNTVEVNIYENTNIQQVINAGNVLFFTQLEAPLDIVVSQEGASLFCYVAIVNNADNYILTIGGVELPPSATNVIDITSYITQPGDHIITAKAVSDNPQLLASNSKSTTYTYQIKLATPIISLDESDGYKILFDSIPFATTYKYSINNNEFTYIDFLPGDPISIDINDKVVNAGVYVIKVKAYGTYEEAFKPSEVATLSFIKRTTLDAVTLNDANISVIRDGTNLLLDWDAVANAVYYTVFVDDVMAAKTKLTAYNWTLGDLNDNSEIKVVADGYSYYNVSPAATVTYVFDTLDTPDLGVGPYIVGDEVVLSWTAVPNATGYTINLDGVAVGEPITTTNYTVAHTSLTSGIYTVTAIADYFKPATSADVTVALPQLVAPIIAYSIDNTDVIINWVAVSNATSYELYKVGTPDPLDTSNTAQFTFNYTEGGSYNIVAKGAGYQSSTSNTVIVPAP